jgi:hypothetical protein
MFANVMYNRNPSNFDNIELNNQGSNMRIIDNNNNFSNNNFQMTNVTTNPTNFTNKSAIPIPNEIEYFNNNYIQLQQSQVLSQNEMQHTMKGSAFPKSKETAIFSYGNAKKTGSISQNIHHSIKPFSDQENNDNDNDNMDGGEDPLDASKETTGRWTREEHLTFIKGLELYGKGWKKIACLIKTRTGQFLFLSFIFQFFSIFLIFFRYFFFQWFRFEPMRKNIF